MCGMWQTLKCLKCVVWNECVIFATKRLILQQNQSYPRVGAWALMLLFTAFWSLKTVHILALHHHHAAEHPVCEVSHDPGAAHIHDERWAKEDCSICAFVVSVPEPFSLPAFQLHLSKLPESESPVFYQEPVFAKKASDSVMRRGPPQLLVG